MGKVYRIFRRVVADGKSVPVTDHDLTPQDIIDRLDLRRPQFEATARYGHFGNGNVWDVAG